MKNYIVAFFLVLAGITATQAQETPSDGLLPSRKTTVNRLAMAATIADGIHVYDTDTKSLWFWDASVPEWKEVGTPEPWFGTDDNAGATDNTEDIYSLGDVGIGTDNPSTNLHIRSAAGEDAVLLLESDLANDVPGEEDNPILRLSQDAGSVNTDIGITGSAALEYIGGLGNSAYIKTDNGPLQLATNGSARLTIEEGGNVGIGTIAPNENSNLELGSSTKGLRLNRVSLTSTSVPAPLLAHVSGMLVYNTVSINNVTPGIYYNDGTKWVRNITEIEDEVQLTAKIQNFGAFYGNPITNVSDAVTLGDFEFRYIDSNGAAAGGNMQYQMKPVTADAVGSEVEISTLNGIGVTPPNGARGSITFIDATTWRIISVIANEGIGHMTYISVNPTGAAGTIDPKFYVLNVQRIGGATGAGLKSLIINMY